MRGSWEGRTACVAQPGEGRFVAAKPEIALRSELQRRGLRFRKNHRLDLATRRVRPDIVFTRSKVAVFVDGCFWHLCPEHASAPKANAQYWKRKLKANVERDVATDDALAIAGWTVVRVWEHQDLGEAADIVASVVRSARITGHADPTQPPLTSQLELRERADTVTLGT